MEMQKFVILVNKNLIKNKDKKIKIKKKKIVTLEIIVIIQENIKALWIAYVISNIICPKKFLQFSIMNQTMIISLS